MTLSCYVVDQQAFDIPWFGPAITALTASASNAPIIPQAIVVPIGRAGVAG